MKPLLLTLTLLLLTLLPATAVKKIYADPINIAITLVDKTDSTKVASTLTYYGYTFQNIEDGYTVMKDSNGNEIRYFFKESDPSNKYPTVIIKTKGNHHTLDSKLKELNFEKVGNGYERMKTRYSKYKTQCKFGHNSTMTIRQIPN